MVIATENTRVIVSEDWCKKCGICIAFCPKKVLASDELGRVLVVKPEECIACKICERLCPDFAINIEVSKDE
ncbi:MAG: 4Fe-4S binding protein [Desulfitobacterium hafniense]|nr:4Fe-4S binding protein [Desulfitobacterium hafniense]